MYGLLYRNMRKGLVLFLCVSWIVLGCGDFNRDYGAGGTDKSGSLFNVESIQPVYFDQATDQVDVFQNRYCSNDPENPDPEPFTDHYANVVLSNRSLPNSEVETNTDIYLTEYQVSYQAVTQGSPDLEPFTINTLGHYAGIVRCEAGVVDCGQEISGVEFVPVRLKEVLAQYITDTGLIQLEYNIKYVFFGENDFGYDVSADGIRKFYVGDYDHCGGGGQ